MKSSKIKYVVWRSKNRIMISPKNDKTVYIDKGNRFLSFGHKSSIFHLMENLKIHDSMHWTVYIRSIYGN